MSQLSLTSNRDHESTADEEHCLLSVKTMDETIEIQCTHSIQKLVEWFNSQQIRMNPMFQHIQYTSSHQQSQQGGAKHRGKRKRFQMNHTISAGFVHDCDHEPMLYRASLFLIFSMLRSMGWRTEVLDQNVLKLPPNKDARWREWRFSNKM